MREICEGEARDEDEALLEAITHIMVSKTDEEKKNGKTGEETDGNVLLTIIC